MEDCLEIQSGPTYSIHVCTKRASMLRTQYWCANVVGELGMPHFLYV